MRRGAPYWLALTTVLAVGWLSVPSAVASAPGEDPLAAAQTLLRNGNYKDAIKAFKKLRGKDKTCAQCAWGLAEAYYRARDLNKALAACDNFLPLATSPRDQARAHNLKGAILFLQADGKDAKRLEKAAQEFATALRLDSDLAEIHYNLGMVLLKLSRDKEGTAELQQYLTAEPQGKMVGEARRYLAKPALGRADLAPDFVLTTLDGSSLALKQLSGKVVLLDFWATWCAPCVESVPALRRLSREFDSSRFALVSVSLDTNDEAWRKFVAKQEMSWPEIRDPAFQLFRALKLASPNTFVIPSYVLLDGDGVVLKRYAGQDNPSVLESDIRAALAQQTPDR